MAGFMPAIHVLLLVAIKDVGGPRNSGTPEFTQNILTCRKSGRPDLR
jgi:hypothetical protein